MFLTGNAQFCVLPGGPDLLMLCFPCCLDKLRSGSRRSCHDHPSPDQRAFAHYGR